MVSIAASQILLGLALASLDRHGKPEASTAADLSGADYLLRADHILSDLGPGTRAGFPQIKKFYVYLMLVFASTAFRKIAEVRVLAFVCKQAPPPPRL